jgi:hypothetical protein
MSATPDDRCPLRVPHLPHSFPVVEGPADVATLVACDGWPDDPPENAPR